MKSFKSLVLDYLWVIVAYFRGKVLRQKAYRPQGDGKVQFFHASRGATVRRILILMKWWGCRLLTVEELLVLQGMRFATEDELRDLAGCRKLELYPEVPTIDWNDNQLSIGHFDADGLTFDHSFEHDHWGSLGFLPTSH
ncbi:MAG: hypothetical protein M0Q93_02175 [Terrimicrobiaceae bacterium]|nr:hypothetical protein [Terrimicrobiaceae bacterium]